MHGEADNILQIEETAESDACGCKLLVEGLDQTLSRQPGFMRTTQALEEGRTVVILFTKILLQLTWILTPY